MDMLIIIPLLFIITCTYPYIMPIMVNLTCENNMLTNIVIHAQIGRMFIFCLYGSTSSKATFKRVFIILIDPWINH